MTEQITVTAATPVSVAVTGTDPQTVTVVGGVPGPPGQPGPPGGPPGPVGPAGQPRWSGQGPPSVIVGAAPGDDYLDETTGTIYRLT